MDGLDQFLKKYEPSARVTKYTDKLDIAYTILQQNVEPGKHLIDLKQSFARSPHKKRKASGGWYMVIPIGLPYDRGRKAYGSKAWNIPVKGNYGTYNGLASPKQLQQRLGKSQHGVLPQLQYSWRGSSVDKRQKGPSGKRSSYFQFRTVSDKSPASSWIINRQGASQDQTTQDLGPIISQVLMAQVEKYNQLSQK